ncbi:MAG: hypothetical protein EA382_11930 [Spirochaetaceae bacterium]|nr:MAG: hypothetical protein EA382_11930 [Spirochaetaceae bacterium]
MMHGLFAPARRIATAVTAIAYLSVAVASVGADLPILADDYVTYEALLEHIRVRNSSVDAIYVRFLHRAYAAATAQEGVSMLVALAQMVHETGALRFGGSVRASQYNYAGLGAVNETAPGLSFANMQIGVLAHVQHLKAYATTEPLRTELVNPRFHLVRRGAAPTVTGLTGTWATDPLYAEKLLAHAESLSRLSAERPSSGRPPDGFARGSD